MKLKVLLADDHQLMLDAVRLALDRDGDFEVVGEALTGRQVLPMVRRVDPDIVLLDLQMPGPDGMWCLAQIKVRFPKVKVVVLSGTTNPRVIETVLRKGASAFVVKTIDPFDLPATLRQAFNGTVFTAIGEAAGDNSAGKAAGLSERESEILNALARGLSNEAIAKQLWVAEQTVKFHLTNIYRKLGVSNRTEAARYAFQHGLISGVLDDHG